MIGGGWKVIGDNDTDEKVTCGIVTGDQVTGASEQVTGTADGRQKKHGGRQASR